MSSSHLSKLFGTLSWPWEIWLVPKFAVFCPENYVNFTAGKALWQYLQVWKWWSLCHLYMLRWSPIGMWFPTCWFHSLRFSTRIIMFKSCRQPCWPGCWQRHFRFWRCLKLVKDWTSVWSSPDSSWAGSLLYVHEWIGQSTVFVDFMTFIHSIFALGTQKSTLNSVLL